MLRWQPHSNRGCVAVPRVIRSELGLVGHQIDLTLLVRTGDAECAQLFQRHRRINRPRRVSTAEQHPADEHPSRLRRWGRRRHRFGDERHGAPGCHTSWVGMLTGRVSVAYLIGAPATWARARPANHRQARARPAMKTLRVFMSPGCSQRRGRCGHREHARRMRSFRELNAPLLLLRVHVERDELVAAGTGDVDRLACPWTS